MAVPLEVFQERRADLVRMHPCYFSWRASCGGDAWLVGRPDSRCPRAFRAETRHTRRRRRSPGAIETAHDTRDRLVIEVAGIGTFPAAVERLSSSASSSMSRNTSSTAVLATVALIPELLHPLQHTTPAAPADDAFHARRGHRHTAVIERAILASRSMTSSIWWIRTCGGQGVCGAVLVESSRLESRVRAVV